MTEPQRSAIKQKHIHTILKLNCYRALLLGEEPEVNLSPEEIAAKMLRQYVCILAAVAIPAYTGYITKANEAADYTTCDAVLTAAQSALAKEGTVKSVEITVGTTPTVKVVYNSGASGASDVTINDITASGATGKVDFDLFFTGGLASFKSGKTKATWNGSAWTLS